MICSALIIHLAQEKRREQCSCYASCVLLDVAEIQRPVGPRIFNIPSHGRLTYLESLPRVGRPIYLLALYNRVPFSNKTRPSTSSTCRKSPLWCQTASANQKEKPKSRSRISSSSTISHFLSLLPLEHQFCQPVDFL